MEEALADFLRYLGVEKNASAYTVKSYREDLGQAVEFFRGRSGGQTPKPALLTTRLLRSYVAWLHEQGYAKTTMARRIAAVRSFCRFLCRQGTLETNPADGLRGPRQDKKLPHFLNEKDIVRLLEAPTTDSPLAWRDRAILETLYSAGLRVAELTGLNVDDVDLDSGLATVRGKGKRERLALLGPHIQHERTVLLDRFLARGVVVGAPVHFLCAGDRRQQEHSHRRKDQAEECPSHAPHGECSLLPSR